MTATIGSFQQIIMQRLSQAGIKETRLEARLILCHVLAVDTAVLIGYPERAVNAQQGAEIETILERRCQREPLSQIFGQKEFWSLPFKVTADTLTPRPDSETLIEAVLRYRPEFDQPLRILDLGTGTGCLLLSLLSEYPNASGVGVDISQAAVVVAQENAKALGMAKRCTIMQGSWFDPVAGQEPFDIIISNPPYIPQGEKASLQPEVRKYDPDLALFGGIDGLDPYRHLAAQAANYLIDDGLVVVEFGQGQESKIRSIVELNGLKTIEECSDLAGITRCAIISKK